MPESQILLKYVTDNESLKATLRASEQLTAAQEALKKSSGELTDEQKQVISTSEAMQKAFNELARERQFDAIAKNAADLRKETKDADKAVEALLDDLQKVGATESEINRVVKQFDQLSNSVKTVPVEPLAGELGQLAQRTSRETESAQRRGSLSGVSRGFSRFRGGTDISTLGGVAEAGLGLGEIGAALPEVAKQAKDAATQLTGPGGIAGSLTQLGLMAGVAGAAIVGFGLVISLLAANAKKRAEEIRIAANAERDIQLEIARGDLTREAAEERIRILKAEIEAEKDIIKRREEELHEAFREGSGGYSEYAKLLEESDEAIKKNQAEIDNLTKVLEDGSLAASDAAAAEAELNNTRQSAQDILQAARDKEAGITPEMKVLQQALDEGLLSAAEASEAEKLLAKMREETAGSTDDAKKAEAEQQKAMQEWVAQQERIAQISENYASAVENAARGAAQATEDAGRKLKDSIYDIRLGTGRQLADDAIKAQQDEANLKRKQYEDDQKTLRDHQRAMRDIIKDANRSQEDLLAERDFLALDQLSKQTKRDIEDQQQADLDAQDEQQRANDEELHDFKQQQQTLRAERLRDYQRSVVDARTQNQRELRDIQVNKQRQLDLATEARNKELRMAQEGINRKLQLEAEYWRRSQALVPGGNGGNATNTQANSVQDYVMQTLDTLGVTG